MKLLNIFKKQKTGFVTKELISLSSLANVPTLDYFKDNNQVLLLINLRKKDYLEILIKEKVLTSSELKAQELHNKLKMIYTLIEQNTLGDELFEKVIFNEEDKVKALIKLRKFAIYNEQIKDLEEEIVSRIIALKEILKKTFLNKQKRISIINEINNLTNIFVILMNQKETLRLCLNTYGLKCFDITKEKDQEKEEKLIKMRKEELNAYQKQAFGKIVYELNDLNDMAQAEVALEDYVYNAKENGKKLREELNNINSIEEIEKLEKKYYLYYEFGKNIVTDEDLKNLYRLKFKYLTIYKYVDGIPKLIEPFVDCITTKIEMDIYVEKIYEIIDILNSKDNLSHLERRFNIDSFTAINLLRLIKKELQVDGKYDAIEILRDKYKLNILMAFADFINTKALREIYRNIYVLKSNYPEVNFYEPEFGWNDYLPLETINELKLMQNQKKDIGLYLFLKKYSYEYYSKNFEYYLPEGLNKVDHLLNNNQTPQEIHEIMHFMEILRQNMKNKVVIFPKTLKKEFGDLIGDIELRGLRLNEGLEFFYFDPDAKIKEIVIPSTIICFVMHQVKVNTSLETICFLDFDKSRFYDNVENLKNILKPYIKITPYEKLYREKKQTDYLFELNIDQIIIYFSNGDYPRKIILKKDKCKIYLNGTSINVGIKIMGIDELIKYINYLIMKEIANHRIIKKLTKH